MALAAAQLDERLKSVLEPSFFLLVGEARQSPKMPPITTPVIPSKPRGELARDEGAQKTIRKDAAVIQPHLEIVGRSLDRDRGFETGLNHFLDGVGTDIVYQTQRMWPLRPDKDVSAASDCLSRFNWERSSAILRKRDR